MITLRYQKNRSGFTLTELVMVLSIMSLFLVLTIPNMLAYRDKTILRGASLQISGDLTAARMEAIKQNCNVIVSFISANEYGIIIDKNSNNSHDSGEPKTIKNLEENYPRVKNIKADTKNIFNSRGAMNRMRTITLKNASGIINISISLPGRIQVH